MERELKEVVDTLQRLSDQEQAYIDAFDKRISFLNTHKQSIRAIISASKTYRNERTPDNLLLLRDAAHQLLTQLTIIMQEILTFDGHANRLFKEELLRVNKEQTIFEEEFSSINLLRGQPLSPTVAQKITTFLQKQRAAAGDLAATQDTIAHLQTFMLNLHNLIREQQTRLQQELALLDKLHTPDPDTLEQDEQQLNYIIAQLEAITQREKNEIITPINTLLKNKKDVTTRVNNFLAGKDTLTLADIKELLRATTHTPEDVLKVQALLIKNAFLLDTTPLKEAGGRSCLDVVSRYGLAALHNSEQEKLAIQNKNVLDEMTGVFSKAYFSTILATKILEASQHHQPTSLLFLDGDKFKHLNDTYGHQIGDEIIKFIASMAKRSVKSSDIVCRNGGDEFTVIFPNTPNNLAFVGAERIRANVLKESSTFLTRISIPELSITVTGGIATHLSLAPLTNSAAQAAAARLIAAADGALIAGKKIARNTIYVNRDIIQ